MVKNKIEYTWEQVSEAANRQLLALDKNYKLLQTPDLVREVFKNNLPAAIKSIAVHVWQHEIKDNKDLALLRQALHQLDNEGIIGNGQN